MPGETVTSYLSVAQALNANADTKITSLIIIKIEQERIVLP